MKAWHSRNIRKNNIRLKWLISGAGKLYWWSMARTRPKSRGRFMTRWLQKQTGWQKRLRRPIKMPSLIIWPLLTKNISYNGLHWSKHILQVTSSGKLITWNNWRIWNTSTWRNVEICWRPMGKIYLPLMQNCRIWIWQMARKRRINSVNKVSRR